MAGRPRLLLIAVALAPLPLLAGVAAIGDADAARSLPKLLVSSRDGDLYVGDRAITTDGTDTEPDWSPDRRRIVFVRRDPGKRSTSLYVVRRDGGGLQRLTHGEQVVAMPAWRGDGLLVAYAASPLAGGSFDIWTIDPAGGEPQRVASGPTEQVSPAFTRDGLVTFSTLEPGEPFPEKQSDAGTPPVGPRELLPDFDQRAPFRLTLAGTRLGFASATDNVGEGPIWVRGSRASKGRPMVARQLVRLSDGSVRTYDDAGRLRYTAESTHSHWHLLDFQRYELRTPEGDLVVRDRKSGFCLADHYGLARRRVASFTGGRFYGHCAASNPGALSVEQGTSVGYTDLYPPHFHGQNLELRGVPAGIYVLVHRANPEERLEELDYANNDASLRIRLTWKGDSPRVKTLRRCEGSADC
ncbi:MAG TPA: lysyl oxidase family protein [Gaiellaceae bacterium]|nr:lysyl oxidase family protein [Gaiellaceae bacterium]